MNICRFHSTSEKLSRRGSLLAATPMIWLLVFGTSIPAGAATDGGHLIYRVGFLGNAHARYGDGPPNCLMDQQVGRRHELLLEVFAREFPGVDDLLVYTYDQDAWLCSEFGPCPRCLGIPLHERLVPFLDCVAAKWRSLSPKGRVWWEPWELSAG